MGQYAEYIVCLDKSDIEIPVIARSKKEAKLKIMRLNYLYTCDIGKVIKCS